MYLPVLSTAFDFQGIVSDTSVRRSNGTSSFAMHEETQDNCTATRKLFAGLGLVPI